MRWGSVLAGLGGLLVLSAGLQAGLGKAWDNDPQGPPAVEAKDLGLSYRGPKNWYVYGSSSMRLDQNRWVFEKSWAPIFRYLKEIYPMYHLGSFYKLQEPTPELNQSFETVWIELLPKDDPQAVMKAYWDQKAVLVRDFKKLAGPVDDKVGGKRASTVAYEGQMTYPFSPDFRTLRVQTTLVPMDGGILLLGAYASPKEWAEFKPVLRAWRHSFKLVKPKARFAD